MRFLLAFLLLALACVANAATYKTTPNTFHHKHVEVSSSRRYRLGKHVFVLFYNLSEQVQRHSKLGKGVDGAAWFARITRDRHLNL